jgi:hypothetical protein
MEAISNLKMPAGTIHDINYLYNVIAGLKRKGGQAESDIKTFDYFRKMINDYNDVKASKYGLSFKPKEVNIKVVENALGELKSLKLVRKENGYLILTNEGENVASLIEKKDSTELKKVFAKLMLENFNVFEYFLKRIKEVSGGNGIPIPFISSDVFNTCDGNPKKIAENYVNLINRNCPNLVIKPNRLYDVLENSRIDSVETKTDKIKKIQAIIEQFVVSEAFQPHIKSRRAYDFIRSRTTFLELTNHAIFDFAGLPAEVTYLISDLKPVLRHTMKRVDYFGGSIYVNYPTFEEIRELFKDSIMRTYITKKDEFGYMKIAELRDMVCRELRISDGLFDTYLKRLHEEEPQWLSFTYSGAGDKITEKRLPIVFEKPIREFFTLLKVNIGR